MASGAPPEFRSGRHDAGSIFDIIGSSNVFTGTRASRGANPLLKALSNGKDTLQPNKNILTCDTFHPSEFVNAGIDKSNPIWVYGIEWMPSDYTARALSGSAPNHPNHSIYLDTSGTSTEFTPTIEGFSFEVVPAPASMVLLGRSGLVATRGRRP